MVVELTLLSRHCCHLCQDMEAVLKPLAAELGMTVKVVDVASDPLLEATYDELVPVLLHGRNELCHYFLDEPKTREYLAGIR
jgi:thioredoxin reductase (NADPH)